MTNKNQKPLEILVVEDNPNFSEAAKQVIESRGHSMQLATTFKEAEDYRKQKPYDFILIDGFFQYAKDYVEKVRQEGLDSVRGKGSKEFMELLTISRNLVETIPDYFSFPEYINCLEGNEETPFGVILAEELKQEGQNNYLIVSAANHHHNTYAMLRDYAEARGLNLFLEDVYDTNTKADLKFWEEALDRI